MRGQLTRGVILLSAVMAISAADARAQGNWRPGDFGSLRVWMGVFEPAADSRYWDDVFADFTGAASDFQDGVVGVDYLWRTSSSGGVLFGTSAYEGQTTQAYRDYVDERGYDISHLTTLDQWDLTATWVARLGQGQVVPYVGVGGGFLHWRLTEEGDFIDFVDPDMPIVFARYRDEGWTWEALALVGLDFQVSYRWSVFVEGRYRWADDELGGDLAGLGTIDLGGGQVAAGLSWNF